MWSRTRRWVARVVPREGSGVRRGALGGALSAGLNPIIDATGRIPAPVLNGIETLVSASVAGALGFNVQGAVSAAQNETQNNWLSHKPASPMALSEQQQLDNAIAACNQGNNESCKLKTDLLALSKYRDDVLAGACAGGSGAPDCKAAVAAALAGGNFVKFDNGTARAIDPNAPSIKAIDSPYQQLYAGSFGGRLAANLLDGLQNAPVDLLIIATIKGIGKLFGIGAETIPTVSTSGWKVFNGIELNPALPPPVAGWDYSPNMLKGNTSNQIWAHWTGYQGEINLANTVAGLPNESVLHWGDAIGTNGNDIVSVNRAPGQVTLWDSKYSSAVGSLKSSPTFTPGSNRLNSAIDQARLAVENSALPDSVKATALGNINRGNFVTNTVGSGGYKNSVQVRFCNGSPC